MTCPKCGHYILDEPHSRESQNMFHILVRAIAREMGENFERVKLQIKTEVVAPIMWDDFVRRMAHISTTVKVVPKYRGAWVDLHDVYEQYTEGTYAFVKSEADYTKRQDAEAIEVATRWAAELGIDVERL